jgi:transcriptional antiterminator NusG
MEQSEIAPVQEPEKSHFFVVRVTIGREMQVMERFESQADRAKGVYAIIKPYSLKGYLIVESDSMESIGQLTYNIKHVRGVIRREISAEEALKTTEKKQQVIEINVGDIVKVTTGPFKGETATVRSVDKDKGEITVLFVESTVPINVNIKMSDVMLIKTEESKNENKS